MTLKPQPADVFEDRHNAPGADEQAAMLRTIGVASIEQLIDETVPPAIRLQRPLNLPGRKAQTWAVAPAVDLSGERGVDPLLQADAVYG